MPLHPQAESYLRAKAESPRPPWNEIPAAEGRKLFSELTPLFGEGPELDRVEDLQTASGVPIRLYQKDASAKPAVMMFFHGGGFVLGNIESHDTLCRQLAECSGCAVASVDYRLAPESPFPAANDDSYEATQFLADQSDALGLDASRLIVCGDSAGGNLATTVALRARDQNGPTITLQVLIYPVLETDFETDSYRDYAEGFGLSRDVMKWFWEHYLGEQAPTSYAVPTLADSLSGLPPAHVITAEYDVLKTEVDRYAELLRAAGVPTTTRQYDGMLHGFVHFNKAFDDGRSAIDDIAAIVREHIES